MPKINPQALAYVGAAVCGVATGLLGLANLANESYGRAALDVLSSLYPGYSGNRTTSDVLILVGYAMVKGAALGWLTAWLYNRVNR
jgi:hypothetical protein